MVSALLVLRLSHFVFLSNNLINWSFHTIFQTENVWNDIRIESSQYAVSNVEESARVKR